MNKSREILVLLIVFLLASCGDAESTKVENENQTKDSIISFDDIKPIENLPTRLNDQNVVDFLTAYGIENTETTLKIVTEFGDIKIRLYVPRIRIRDIIISYCVFRI